MPAIAALCIAGYVIVYQTTAAGQPIRSDGFSYYVYLPSWFIYGDSTLDSVARDCCGGEFPAFTAIIRWPKTHHWVNAHPIGVAIMQAPMFLLAHALTRWSNLSPDGFSLYYEHGAGLSGLLWIVAGIWILRRLLSRHFSPAITSATLIVILLGTNLYHFATFDSGYSHPYSFFLIAALLDLTERWHQAPGPRLAALLGLVSGLVILTRHTNALFLLFVPLYGVASSGTVEALARFRSRARDVAVWALTTTAVVAPQLAIYRQSTGRLVISSYGDLGFNFGSPRLYGVLFGVQKGLFFWSPVLLLALAGLFMLRGAARAFLLPAILVLLADTYLIASWWDWQFGASYGHRGFTDALPVFALGLAAFFQWSAGRRLTRVVATVAVLLATCLSVFQMVQYWYGILPASDTTWEQYRAVFLKMS